MKFIKTLFWHSLIVSLSLTPCLSKENFLSELKNTKRFKNPQQDQGEVKPLLIASHITPVKNEEVAKTSSISCAVKGMEGVFSSESINLLLVEGAFGQLNFKEPLRFLSKEGVEIATLVSIITIGPNPRFQQVGIKKEAPSHTSKTFTNRTEFKMWVGEITKYNNR